MSTSDTAVLLDRPARISSRLLRSELRLVFTRRRNLAILAVLACAPILLGIAIKLGSRTGAAAVAARRSSARSPRTASSWRSPRSS